MLHSGAIEDVVKNLSVPTGMTLDQTVDCMYRTGALPLREWVRYYALTLHRAGSEQSRLCHTVVIQAYFEAFYSAIE